MTIALSRATVLQTLKDQFHTSPLEVYFYLQQALIESGQLVEVGEVDNLSPELLQAHQSFVNNFSRDDFTSC